MPNFDGGHYFLTVLAPVRTDDHVDGEGSSGSRRQALRDALACLPTARQSPATIANRINSPFARSKRTHFARFVVIDDVVYNGRQPTDAIVAAVRGPDPSVMQPVDRLASPFLFFAADFDAASDSDQELKSYLGELWQTMEAELRAIFQHCVDFDRVTDAVSFYQYVKDCQIETTMPFNDYWTGPIPAENLSFLAPTVLGGGGALVALIAVVLWIFGVGTWPWGWIALGGVVAVVLAVLLAYAMVMRRGHKPLPTAPDSDLRSVLKAIYLQQAFIRFATDMQGADAATLHRAFGQFVATHKPGDLDGPTQEPGVIRAGW